MKKAAVILLVLVLVFSLTACKSKEASAADELIAAIGEVTLNSGAAIEQAETACAALSEKDLGSLDNYQTLTAAKATLATLTKLSDQIGEIGEVSFDKQAAIEQLETAFNALTDTQKAAFTNADTLAQAGETLAALADMAAQIDALGEVTEANLDAAQTLMDSYEALSDAQRASFPNAETAEAARSALYNRTLAGTWQWDIDLTKIEPLDEETLAMYAQVDKEIPAIMAPFLFVFEKDGSGRCYVDADKFKENFSVTLDELCEVSAEIMYRQMQQEGISRADADNIIQSYFGMSTHDYLRSIMEDAIDLEDMGDYSESFTYQAQGDKLLLSSLDGGGDAYLLFSLADGVMTISGCSEAFMFEALEFPQQMVKIA